MLINFSELVSSSVKGYYLSLTGLFRVSNEVTYVNYLALYLQFVVNK